MLNDQTPPAPHVAVSVVFLFKIHDPSWVPFNAVPPVVVLKVVLAGIILVFAKLTLLQATEQGPPVYVHEPSSWQCPNTWLLGFKQAPYSL